MGDKLLRKITVPYIIGAYIVFVALVVAAFFIDLRAGIAVVALGIVFGIYILVLLRVQRLWVYTQLQDIENEVEDTLRYSFNHHPLPLCVADRDGLIPMTNDKFKEIFPDFEKEAPVERKITHERISMLSHDSNLTIDFSSALLTQPGKDSYSVLRAPFDAWLAEKAESEGAEYIYGIAVDDVIKDGSRVIGIKAGDDEISGDVVILADGVNSLLTQKAGLQKGVPSPNQMAVGLKETIALPQKTISDRMQCSDDEGAAWLFVGDVTKGKVGGGFLYSNRESISLGLVATLSSACTGEVPVYQMLEDFKQHPAIAPIIAGGKTVEYSGHLIPEGGYDMIPELFCDGCMVTGDAAMLCINLGYQVRGMDFAITAGKLAAETALAALAAGDTSAAVLADYKTKLDNSFVIKDLKAFRRAPAFLEHWDRMFNEYPLLCRELFTKLFLVDGTPVEPMKKKAMGALKGVGMLNLLKDARGAMKSL